MVPEEWYYHAFTEKCVPSHNQCKVGTFLLCDASMLKCTRVTVLRFHCGEEKNGFYIDVILPVVVCSSMSCVCCHTSVVINNSCECSHKGEEYKDNESTKKKKKTMY